MLCCLFLFFFSWCLMAYGHNLVSLYWNEQLRHSFCFPRKEGWSNVGFSVMSSFSYSGSAAFYYFHFFFSLSVSFSPVPHFISAACSCALHQSWNGIMGNISPPHWTSVPARPSGKQPLIVLQILLPLFCPLELTFADVCFFSWRCFH